MENIRIYIERLQNMHASWNILKQYFTECWIVDIVIIKYETYKFYCYSIFNNYSIMLLSVGLDFG